MWCQINKTPSSAQSWALNFQLTARKNTDLIFCGNTAQREPGSFHWDFWITHNDAPQSAGLLWTSDQLVAETSDNRQTCMPPCGNLAHNLNRRAVVDLCLGPRGHRNWLIILSYWNSLWLAHNIGDFMFINQEINFITSHISCNCNYINNIYTPLMIRILFHWIPSQIENRYRGFRVVSIRYIGKPYS